MQKCVWCGIEPCDYYRAAEAEKRIAELETLLREVLEKHDAELADAKAHLEDDSEFADGIVTCGEIAALRFDALVSEWGELAERIRKQVGKP